MRCVLGWMAVMVLCVAPGAGGAEEPADPKLLEAQAALDEATKLKAAGKYAEALARGEHALALREAVLGSGHPEVAKCLNVVGDLYRRRGDLAHAEPLMLRGLAIREGALGKNHPDVAHSLNNLAILYKEQGQYGRAEPLYQRAITIWEEALGQNHPDVAHSLNNLANLYIEQGLYGRAEPLCQRALAIREAALGRNHPLVGTSLNNLANRYKEQGLYGRAEPLYQRALAIWEADLGKSPPDAASTLNNLANLYKEQGLYGRAEPLYQRALAIREAALGKNHPLVAHVLSNLAVIYEKQGLYDRAEPFHQRALAILEGALGKEHPDVATALNNLGVLYWAQGQYGRAKPLFQRALGVREVALGKNHPQVASTLSNLANLYWAQGQYERAEPLHQRALAIKEAALGGSHPSIAESLNNLARLRLAQHRLADALPFFTRAFVISEQRLHQEALGFSELRLTSFLQFLRSDEETLYALLRAHPEDSRVRHMALSVALLLKGRSAEETANTSRTVYRGLGSEDRETFERLRALRTQLATLSLQGPGKLSPQDYQQRLKELAEQGDALEADLAKRSAPLRALTALPSPAEIAGRTAASLPGDAALVELVAYRDHPLVPPPGTPFAKLPSQLRYLALMLFPDGSTRAVDLGSAAAIDRAASRLRDALATRDADFLSHSQALYTLAFRPLLPLLGKTRRVFLSPDGQLSVVPFAVLHDGQSFLVDSFDFTYLTSGRDLLPRPQDTPPSRAVVVLANPDFSASPPAPLSAPGATPLLAERSASLEGFYSTLRADLAARPWAPLPGTGQEAEAIQRLFPQAQVLLGAEATKEKLLNLPTPGVLHLATHGFFLEDAPTPAGARAVGHFGALNEDVLSQRPPDPLVRSGLVLAGARAPASGATGASKSSADAALVTALELAGLNLWGTQLAVLSACDTGRGDVKLGQGVYGLRRALVVAGAETVVMSLWKVNDETTRALMEIYYQNLLAGQGRASALREAMRALRQSKPHPHYWAPFIALGRDAPLLALTPTSPETPGR
jgi:CHAT domain-containing protein/Tfp pilus assembly protein PilF